MDASDAPEAEETVAAWKPRRVARWLNQTGIVRGEVAAAAQREGVDGGALLQMGEDAWLELGVESAIARARLKAAIEK